LYESVSKYAFDFETLSTSVLGYAQNCPRTQTPLGFCTPPSVAEMSFLGIPKKLLQMMVKLKYAERILI